MVSYRKPHNPLHLIKEALHNLSGLRENLLATLYRKMGDLQHTHGKHTFQCVKKLKFCTHVDVHRRTRHTTFQTQSVRFDVDMTSSILRHLYRKVWALIEEMEIFHKINFFAHLFLTHSLF